MLHVPCHLCPFPPQTCSDVAGLTTSSTELQGVVIVNEGELRLGSVTSLTLREPFADMLHLSASFALLPANRMGVLDIVPAGVVSGKDVYKVFDYARENKFAIPAFNVTVSVMIHRRPTAPGRL